MNDAAWCRAQLDHLDDSLRRHGHSDSRFAGLLDETRLIWSDQASRDTFARFLDPYRAQMAETLKRLTAQLTRLRDVVARMEEAEKPAGEVQRFSEEAARLRQLADEGTKTTHHRMDRALDEAAIAQEHGEEAQKIIASI